MAAAEGESIRAYAWQKASSFLVRSPRGVEITYLVEPRLRRLGLGAAPSGAVGSWGAALAAVGSLLLSSMILV